MAIKRKITAKVSKHGNVEEIIWKPDELKKMLLPQRAIVKIPNAPWAKLQFPLNDWTDVVPEKKVSFQLNIFLPKYSENLKNKIAAELQEVIYDSSQNAEKHQRAGLQALVRFIKRKSPPIRFGKLLCSFDSHNEMFWRFFRFTKWSIIPADLLQSKISWETKNEDGERVIEVVSDLIFNQEDARIGTRMITNRRGVFGFNLIDWNKSFCLEEVINEELPTLTKYREKSSAETISSAEESPKREPKPEKRLKSRIERFVISSDEE